MATNMSKRVMITLPDGVVDELQRIADEQGRSLANLVAFFTEVALRDYQRNIKKDSDK